MSDGTIETRGGWVFLRLSQKGRPRVKLGPSTMAPAQIEAAALAVRQELASGRFVFERAAPVLTFDAWAETWFQARAKRLSSVRDDRQRWSKWCKPLHFLDVRKVGRADLEGVVRALDEAVEEERITWKTARNVWGVLSKMCADMSRSKSLDLRIRDDNPAEGVEPPDGGDDDGLVYLYPDELAQLIASPRVDAAWRALYALSAYTGLRRGELDALRWADVEPTVLRVARATRVGGEVRRTKSGDARTVPIEPSLRPLLEALRSTADKHVCRAPLWQAPQFRAHLVAAGVERAALFARGPGQRPIRFHDLRATCATWQAVRGDDPLKIQRRLGHRSLSTTQRYIREAETIGDVGTPFPVLPEALFSDLSHALSQGQQEERKSLRKPMILASPTGFEAVRAAAKSTTSETDGTTGGPRSSARPDLAKCGPLAVELDLHAWAERELLAGGGS